VLAVHWCTRSGEAADADKGCHPIAKKQRHRGFNAMVPFVFSGADLVLSNTPTLDFLPSFSSASE
jgi:hypothetical protein